MATVSELLAAGRPTPSSFSRPRTTPSRPAWWKRSSTSSPSGPPSCRSRTGPAVVPPAHDRPRVLHAAPDGAQPDGPSDLHRPQPPRAGRHLGELRKPGGKPDGAGRRPASDASVGPANWLTPGTGGAGPCHRGFCIGVAAHPGRHPRSRSLASDDVSCPEAKGRRLRRDAVLLRAGRLLLPGGRPGRPGRRQARPAGHTAGDQLSSSLACRDGCAAPAHLVERLEAAQARAAARTWSRRGGRGHGAVLGLAGPGAPGLHFYTFNRSEATRRIHANLGLSVAAG